MKTINLDICAIVDGQHASVVNPTAWFGNVHAVGVACGYWVTLYAVEADSLQDSLDEFADSGHFDSDLVDPADIETEVLARMNDPDDPRDPPDTIRLGNAGELYWSQDLYLGREHADIRYVYRCRSGRFRTVRPDVFERLGSAPVSVKFGNIGSTELELAGHC